MSTTIGEKVARGGNYSSKAISILDLKRVAFCSKAKAKMTASTLQEQNMLSKLGAMKGTLWLEYEIFITVVPSN